jgi:hypothetical protein
MIQNRTKRTWKTVTKEIAISAVNFIWSLYLLIRIDTLLPCYLCLNSNDPLLVFFYLFSSPETTYRPELHATLISSLWFWWRVTLCSVCIWWSSVSSPLHNLIVSPCLVPVLCSKSHELSVFNAQGNRSHWPRVIRPLACWDCGFDSRRGHRCVCW